MVVYFLLKINLLYPLQQTNLKSQLHLFGSYELAIFFNFIEREREDQVSITSETSCKFSKNKSNLASFVCI